MFAKASTTLQMFATIVNTTSILDDFLAIVTNANLS